MVAALLSGSTTVARAGLDHLTLVDGTTSDAVVVAIGSNGRIRLAGSTAEVDLEGLLTIDRAPLPVRTGGNAAAPYVVELLGGGRLLVSSVNIIDQQCHVHWPEGGDLAVPIESIAAVRLNAQVRDEKFEAALGKPKRDVDRLLVRGGNKTDSIEGTIEGLDDRQATIEWQGKQRTVPRDAIVGVVLAVIGSPPDRTGHCLVSFSSGSSVWCRVNELREGKLTIELAPKVPATVAWHDVVWLGVRSTRLAYLSDLDPVEVSEEPIVTAPMPWQRDKSVGGRALTIGGRTFAKGIGVHARSLLRFAADGKFDLLGATIGIDAETAGHGDCEFVVLGDDRELYRQRVAGRDAPRDIQVPIRGVRQVTLLVEPGADLDLGDHADWGNVRLWRKAEQR